MERWHSSVMMKVEGRDGDGGIVGDGERGGRQDARRPSQAGSLTSDVAAKRQLVAGAFVDLGVDLFAAKHGVKALDGGDADAADLVELRRLQVLDVVKLGELAAVVGRDELLEFFQSLVAEVAAVDEEEDAARAGELDEAVNEVDGGVGVSRACGHLDDGAALVGRAGVLSGSGGFDLCG